MFKLKKQIKKQLKILALMAVILPALAGCGESPDVDLMKAGLSRTGMSAAQVDCYAEKMADTVDGEPYNYMAKLMKEGLKERAAMNKARRKFGPDFQAPVREARKACTQ